MQESQEHYFEEDSLYQSITKYEDMVRSNVITYFDVYEFEIIVDYYLDRNHFNKADDALQVALKQHPASQELRYRLAQLHISSGKPSKGIRLLRDIESLESSNSEFYILKGTALNLLGKMEEATQAFSEAIKLATDNRDDVIYGISLSYITNRRYNHAIRYLKLALEINPENLDVIHELALVYERIDNQKESIKYLKNYLDVDPFNDNIWFSLGVTYSSIDDIENAINAYEYATALRPSNIAALFSKANAYINTDEYTKAIHTYQEVLETDNQNVQAYTFIGECYEKLTEYKKAEYFFKRALKYDNKFADAWYGLGISSYQQNNIEECVEHFKKSIEIDPENPDYWFMLGEAYRKISQLRESAEAFNRTVELDPTDYEAWICRAELSFKENSDVKGAIQIIKQALEYNKDNSTLNYQLSTYLYKSSQSKQATQYFEAGLKINFSEHKDFIDDIASKFHSKYINDLLSKYNK